MNSDDHYLKRELYELVRTDPALFEFLQAGSLDGIWYWDLEDSDVEWMSPRFWRVFGYDPATKKHLAAEWQDMIHPDDLAMALENFNKHYADPSHPYDQLVRYTHADGSTVWVRCRGLIIRDAQGTPKRMLGAHNDVTELKRIEEELKEKNLELERANAQLDRFATTASHDLQEPLRKIAAFSELLADSLGEEISPKSAEYLGRVTDGAQRMSRMVQDILALSRAGRANLDLKVTPLDASLDWALAELEFRLNATQARVERGPLPSLAVDGGQLGRVLLNLLSNALKFSEGAPPSVRVDAEQVGDVWRIRVADQGIGFEERFAEQIFDSFRRLNSRSKYDGTGIGLAICRTIVDRHGGRIWAESAPGEGSSFYIELPATS